MRATTIRFSDPIYQRLERASKYSGLPINAIVTAACMEWLRQQFPAPIEVESTDDASDSAALERLLRGHRRETLLLLAQDLRDALLRAEAEARRYRHEAIGTEHLLLGIVAEQAGPGAQALRQVEIDANKVQLAFDFIVGRGQQPVGSELRLSTRAAQAIERAAHTVRERQAGEVDTAYLLLALCDDEESLALRLVESLGGSANELRAVLDRQLS